MILFLSDLNNIICVMLLNLSVLIWNPIFNQLRKNDLIKE